MHSKTVTGTYHDGQGRENVKNYLKEHIELRTAIEEKVRRALGMIKEAPEPVGA